MLHRQRRRSLAPLFCAPLGLAAAATVVAGCSAERTGQGVARAVADTVDGIERLTYPEDRVAELSWHFDTTAVIGGFGIDDPDYQFGGLASESLAGSSDGTLYVLDADGIRVLAYGPDGAFRGSWGREGGGPGELGGSFGGGPRAMAMGPGDTLWINDRANQRLTLFPTSGGEPTSVPIPQAALGIGGGMSVDATGLTALLSTFSFAPGSAEGMPPRPLVRLDRTGEVTDTVWTAPAPPTDVVTISTGGRSLMMMMSRRFHPGFRWVRFSDGGFAVQQTASYEIHLLDPSGGTRRILRRPPPARVTTEADRQAVLDSLLAPPEEESEFNTPEVRRQQAEAATFADSIPRIVEMRRDLRDRLWVGVSEGEPGALDRIDVYDRDGNLLGELRRGMPIPDHFYGEARAAILADDDLDVQQIHLLRLVEDPEAVETVSAR